MSKKTWNPEFGPSFTPMEMLDRGVFCDCCYFALVEGVPSAYSNHEKAFKRGEEPNVKLNYYGVKSRSSLITWRENGWIDPTNEDKAGWFEWYIKYFEGRRRDDGEDERQIRRWKSFVARHMAQVAAKCKLTDRDCNTRQRQGLLQWGWDSETIATQEQMLKNAAAMAKKAGATLTANESSKEDGNKRKGKHLDW